MGADRLALVGAADRAHMALVGRDAEMVRPEPDQPLDEADLGGERGIDARLGLVEIESAAGCRTGLRPRRRRRLLGGLRVRRLACCGRGAAALLRQRLAVAAARSACRAAAARCWNSNAARAASPLVSRSEIGDAAGAGAFELGEQRAARIGRDGRDRSGARPKAEPMQRKRSLSFRIGRHASMSFICQDATPPRKAPWSATAVSRLRQAAFPDHGRSMKNWKGYRDGYHVTQLP